MSGTAVKGGNNSGPQTKTVLRKVKSEYSNLNLVTDVAQETKLLQELYYEQDDGGFIQHFSFRPFKVHLISVRQLHLCTKSKAKGLYFDATSSLIKPIPSQKHFYLYSLVMPHPMGNRMAIPVAKMLTVDQQASEIRHFLAKVIDFSNAHAIQFKPKILQGTTAAFNGIDMKSYLQWCFEVHAKKKTTREIQGKTIVHCLLCGSHATDVLTSYGIYRQKH